MNKLLPLLFATLLIRCSTSGERVHLEEQRFAAALDGRTILLHLRDDTAGGRLIRHMTLDDPLEEKPLTTGVARTLDDSLNVMFYQKQGGPVTNRLVGVRNANGSWQLSYGRGDNALSPPVTFTEHPEPLIFEQKSYTHAVYTYRFTDRASGKPHPLDSALQHAICKGKTYEEYTANGTGGTSLTVAINYRNDERVVLAIEESYYEEGMAHDQMGTRLFNYDLEGGREVGLADVISKPNWGRLKALVKRTFYAKYTDRSMRNSTFEFTENVGVERNGIRFLYQPIRWGRS